MTTILTIVIAALGVVLLAVLVARVHEVNRERKLSHHREKDAAFADLLNYAAVVDDGVIVCKNGAFMAAWIYGAEDNASATPDQRNAVANRVNKALARLGSGWMVHVDAVRRVAPGYSDRAKSHFADSVTAAIDEERRRLFESHGTMYEGYFVLTLTFYPPLLAQRKFVELMFDDDEAPLNRKARTISLIEGFKREVVAIENELSGGLKLQRLKSHSLVAEDGSTITQDDFLRWLQFCVTGLNHPIHLPDTPMYIDSLIGGQEMWTGVVPRIGRRYFQVVAIDGFPPHSHPGLLSALAELPSEYRWSTRFIFMDPHEAKSHLEKYRKRWKQKVRGFFDQLFNTGSGMVDQDALSMVQDADDAIADVNSGLIAQGYYTSVVVLSDEDRTRLTHSALQIAKEVNKLGFTARIETINTVDALLGSFPGHGVENVRRPLLSTMNLAELIPASTIWTGEPHAPSPRLPPHAPPVMFCVTVGATPFRLNLHVRDVGHTCILGPTGAGKSTLLGMLVAQLRRYEGMQVYIFEKGLSMFPLSAAIRSATGGASGQHFDIAGDGTTLNFAPMRYLRDESDRAWAMEWVDTMVALNGLATTPAQRTEIAKAIQQMARDGTHTLSELAGLIQDNAIREALQVYTADGAMGMMLDADDDGLALSDFSVFEIGELMQRGDRYALPVLLYLFRRIERSLDGRPTVIVLDEAWIMLGHEVFRAKIRDWLKTLRKKNCSVVMATQSLTDAVDSGILDVILESTATKIFLPNTSAREASMRALYSRMGLNAQQVSMLAEATPKKHYYYVSEKGRRLFDLMLGPLALSLVGHTDPEAIAEVRQLEKEYGPAWLGHWLRALKLDLNDYLRTSA